MKGTNKKPKKSEATQELWHTLNDLIALFTARVIALPLLCLLIFKLYSIAPETLMYTLALTLLTGIAGTRWGLHYIVRHPKAFALAYKANKSGNRLGK